MVTSCGVRCLEAFVGRDRIRAHGEHPHALGAVESAASAWCVGVCGLPACRWVAATVQGTSATNTVSTLGAGNALDLIGQSLRR